VHAFENSADNVLTAVRKIAAIPLDDGMTFDSSGAVAESIRWKTAITEFELPSEGHFLELWFDST